jgi:hypothetical protein
MRKGPKNYQLIPLPLLITIFNHLALEKSEILNNNKCINLKVILKHGYKKAITSVLNVNIKIWQCESIFGVKYGDKSNYGIKYQMRNYGIRYSVQKKKRKRKEMLSLNVSILKLKYREKCACY